MKYEGSEGSLGSKKGDKKLVWKMKRWVGRNASFFNIRWR
jgi:hypothetical protein